MPQGLGSATVVIVTYNSAADIDACVRSLLAGTHRVRLEIVVVDNASTDDTVDRLRQLARGEDRIRLLTNPTNAGFGAACNQGAAAGSGDHVVLLNPDTTTHDGAIDELVAVAGRPGVGPVAGCTVGTDGRADGLSAQNAPTLLQTVAWALATPVLLSRLPGRLGTTLGRNGVLLPAAEFARERPVEVVIGCLLGIARTEWERLGGFDESYFMYGEDVDLSLRATALGLTPTYTPRAVVTHAVGGSSKDFAAKLVVALSGRATVMSRHWSPARARLGQGLLVIGVALRSLGERATGRAGPWSSTFAARRSWHSGYPERAGQRNGSDR